MQRPSSLAPWGHRLAAACHAWTEAEQTRFVLFLPVCLGSGILTYFAQSTEPGLPAAALLTLAPFAAAAALWRRTIMRAALLAGGFAALGFAAAIFATWRAPPFPALSRTATMVEGVVTRVEALPKGRRVTIASPVLDGATIPRAVRIRLRAADAAPVEPGDRIRVRALIRPPAAPAYPGGWDMQREAFFSGIGGYGYALGPLAKLERHRALWEGLRTRIARRAMAALPGADGAIAATLLTGESAAIPDPVRTAFAASGLAHLLAVAGLHVGAVMALTYALVRTLLAAIERCALRWPVRRIATLASLAMASFYLALTGGHLPILRSVGMAGLVALGVLSGRRAFALRGLAFAATALLLWAPESIMEPGFQLSFAAVLALIAGWEAARGTIQGLAARLAEAGPHWQWARGPVMHGTALAGTSVLAGTATLPFAAYHFGTATLFFVPANLVSVPLMGLWVLPWGIAALILMPFGLDGLAFAPMGWGIAALVQIARGVASWPGASIPVPLVPPAALALTAAGLIWLCLWRTRLRLAGAVPLLAGLALPFLSTPPDIALSGDGQMLAARIGGEIWVEQSGRREAAFDAALTGRLWPGLDVRNLPERGRDAAGLVTCTDAACTLREGARTALLVRSASAGCAGAPSLVLSLHYLHGCEAGLLLDRAYVARQGAVLLQAAPEGWQTETAAANRGDRPWVIGALPKLPLALTE